MSEELQFQLITLLKKKGTGPSMSKSLTSEDLSTATTLLKNESLNLTTRATLLTAILTLSPNQEESNWIREIQNNPPFRQELNDLVSTSSSTPLIDIAKRLMSHKDLDKQEMTYFLEHLADPNTEDFVKAACLEALRLKRETPLENSCTLDFFRKKTVRVQSKLPLIVDLANPYEIGRAHV